MDDDNLRLGTVARFAKRMGIDRERLKQGLEAQASQDPNHRPVHLQSRQAHRKPRTLWRQASVEALLMGRADETTARGQFAAAVVYLPNDGAPVQMVALLPDADLVADLMKLTVGYHAQGRAIVIPATAQKVIADFEALRREGREKQQVGEPTKPEAPASSKLAAKGRE